MTDRKAEIGQLITKVNEKEATLRKLKGDLSSTKINKDQMEMRVPMMESQVLDLNRAVEKLQREAERESRKKADI